MWFAGFGHVTCKDGYDPADLGDRDVRVTPRLIESLSRVIDADGMKLIATVYAEVYPSDMPPT